MPPNCSIAKEGCRESKRLRNTGLTLCLIKVPQSLAFDLFDFLKLSQQIGSSLLSNSCFLYFVALFKIYFSLRKGCWLVLLRDYSNHRHNWINFKFNDLELSLLKCYIILVLNFNLVIKIIKNLFFKNMSFAFTITWLHILKLMKYKGTHDL